MTPYMRPYHGDGGSNNDLTACKYVMYTIFHTKIGGRVIQTRTTALNSICH